MTAVISLSEHGDSHTCSDKTSSGYEINSVNVNNRRPKDNLDVRMVALMTYGYKRITQSSTASLLIGKHC